jgi:hypothetical protein
MLAILVTTILTMLPVTLTEVLCIANGAPILTWKTEQLITPNTLDSIREQTHVILAKKPINMFIMKLQVHHHVKIV